MDMMLPNMSGFEATKRIKSINPNVPIIAQTALVMYEDNLKCLEAGCDEFFSKPINSIELLNKIQYYFLK